MSNSISLAWIWSEPNSQGKDGGTGEGWGKRGYLCHPPRGMVKWVPTALYRLSVESMAPGEKPTCHWQKGGVEPK